jgi:hypothetical protein
MTGFIAQFLQKANVSASLCRVWHQWWIISWISLLLISCANNIPLLPTPAPTLVVSLPPTWQGTAQMVVAALVAAERDAARRGDAPLLAQLWAEDARIVDGRGTVVTDDDLIWSGRAAILDRYALAVFPSPPPPLAPDALAEAIFVVTGDTATLEFQGDHWRFVRRAGRWWLAELIYSTP